MKLIPKKEWPCQLCGKPSILVVVINSTKQKIPVCGNITHIPLLAEIGKNAT